MDIKLTKKLKNQFQEFLVQHPPKRFRRNLRSMFFDYLGSTIDSGPPIYFSDLIHDLDGLFELLDVAEQQVLKTKQFKKNRGG